MLKVNTQRRFNSIHEFQILDQKKIGCGSFGTVRLARHKSTCRMYALKIIDVKDMPSEAELKLVEREIKLHSQLDHPHIIRLWDTLMDGDRIHMIMEYAEQGNLFYHQNTKNTFSQSEAYKYFTQTLKGVQYLHNHNVIHRDLKPENLLLDSLNNIKICDFGWCAEEIKAKRTTFCGTYEYMAPEMLFKSQYDYHVDVWALGVLLYEMLHSHAPFKGKNAAEVQQSMLKGTYTLDKHLSDEVKKLINSILQFQPEKRLSLQQILQHPWMTEMQNHLNNYLKSEHVAQPKDIHQKIVFAPPMRLHSRARQFTAKHRKNNSLNLQDSGHNININFSINNYAFLGKTSKSRNNYHSQERDTEINEFYAKEMEKGPSSTFKKKSSNCKTQASEINMIRVLDKIKSTKSIKMNTKDALHYEREKKKEKDGNESNRKRFKVRKSDVDIGTDKYLIRFNTEANEKEDWEPPKLKKGHMRAKFIGNSKSTLKFLKG